MIYLDHNATTPLDPDALAVMQQAALEAAGNPGSRHPAGRKSRQVLEESRETIARILHAQPDEVIFTSGGTESSNLALWGLSQGPPAAVLLPPGEHPATEEPVQRLLKSGWTRRPLSVDRLGRLDPEEVQTCSLEGVRLATALLAHNETGVIQDLTPLALRLHDAGIPFHVDAMQAIGKLDVNFRDLPATTLALAAHKFNGPRGIGALLVRRGTRLTPLLLGGHQERGLRPGTEPVMLAAGMAAALTRWHVHREDRRAKLQSLRDRLQALLLERGRPCVVNGDLEHRLPGTLHLAFPGCDGEALLVSLDLAGVCCSLGSACASGSTEPSPILLAMGLPRELFQSSLRLSVGWQNTEEEIDRAAEIIAAAVARLRP
jgi:cysteine desulfurase